MNIIRKYLGVVWMAVAVFAIYFLISSAVTNITAGGHADINQPLPWIIIITVFLPIAAGLMLFGWYALKDEYDQD